MSFGRLVAVLTGIFALAGCGDLTSANGEYGRVNYALHTDFEVEGPSLAETSLLVGHPQVIHTSPLDSADYADEDLITHAVSPDVGVVLLQGELVSGGPWNFEVLVETPGTYVFETWKGQVLHDRLEVNRDRRRRLLSAVSVDADEAVRLVVELVLQRDDDELQPVLLVLRALSDVQQSELYEELCSTVRGGAQWHKLVDYVLTAQTQHALGSWPFMVEVALQ